MLQKINLHNIKVNKVILYDFGQIVGGLFAFLAILTESKASYEVTISLLVVGGLLMIIGLFRPLILTWPYRFWMGLGLLLSLIVAPVILGILYYAFFTPIVVIKRTFGESGLTVYDKEVKSYWIKREQDYSPEKSQTLF